jgi:hypothetical protein
MKSTGGDIIKLKDQIHSKWFDLQRTKRGNHDYAFLSKPVYDEIVRLGHEALSVLQEIEPRSPFVRRIEYPLHEVERKSWIAEDIAFIGPTPHYVMTPERGQEVITQDINRLANQIHHAGMSLIQARDEYCGCEITEDVEDISSINTGVLKYCEGALKRYDKTAKILAGGDTVEHRPGSATNHANTIKFIPTERGHNVEMEYCESGDLNWPLRKDGVLMRVEKLGGECETAGTVSQCKIADISDDKILELALMISQLKDIDLMSGDCIPMAFELLDRQSDELKKLEPKDRIWNEPWTVISNMSEIVECAGGVYERRREEEKARQERAEREDIKARRITADIEYMDGRVDEAIYYSKEKPCTAEPYENLSLLDFTAYIRESCEKLKTETTEPFGWCMELADHRDRDIKEAAKDLIDRCPPEGIILGLEGDQTGYGKFNIERVADICKLAENEDCLDIIRQVEARAKEGIKAEKLRLI